MGKYAQRIVSEYTQGKLDAQNDYRPRPVNRHELKVSYNKGYNEEMKKILKEFKKRQKRLLPIHERILFPFKRFYQKLKLRAINVTPIGDDNLDYD